MFLTPFLSRGYFPCGRDGAAGVNLTTKAYAIALVLLLAAVAAIAPTASAHKCRSNSHSGCDGHSCPTDLLPHDHYTVHVGADHWCVSSPVIGAFYFDVNDGAFLHSGLA